jgi:hypothetical protein
MSYNYTLGLIEKCQGSSFVKIQWKISIGFLGMLLVVCCNVENYHN